MNIIGNRTSLCRGVLDRETRQEMSNEEFEALIEKTYETYRNSGLPPLWIAALIEESEMHLRQFCRTTKLRGVIVENGDYGYSGRWADEPRVWNRPGRKR